MATPSGGVGLVVLARMDSSRLPGKALLPIGGRPLLGRVLDRVRRASGFDHLVVATTGRMVDDPVTRFAAGERVAVFRGSTHDVLGRLVAAQQAHGFAHVVRISGDSPFMDPALIDAVIARHLAHGAEVSTNVFPRTFPPGVSVEVLSAAALARLDAMATTIEEREHVTVACYRNPDRFAIDNLAASSEFPATRLVVDDARDLVRAEAVCRALADACTAGLGEIAQAAALWDRLNPPEEMP